MARDNVSKLRLYDDKFSEATHTDETTIEAGLKLAPDKVNTAVIQLLGKDSGKYPMQQRAFSKGAKSYIESTEFEMPVIQDDDKAVAVKEAVSTGTPGKGGSEFEVVFEDNWFPRFYAIWGPSKTQCRVMDDPEKVANGFKYRLRVLSSDKSVSVPLTDLAAGTNWARLYPVVTRSGSVGTDGRVMFPSKIKNRLTSYRFGYTWEGNAHNRAMNLQIGPYKMWEEWEKFQNRKKMLEDRESLLWYTEYNETGGGAVTIHDLNNKPIHVGAGIFDQIPNRESYSSLTANRLTSAVGDLFYGIRDREQVNVTLFTGTGGMREFHNALNAESANYTLVDTKFISGNVDLTFGAYYRKYRHIDGHTIAVQKLPLLDYGPEARVSPKHPDTGFPLSSYRMVFLDESTYDGKQNIRLVTRKKRENISKIIPGMNAEGYDWAVSDYDGSAQHFMGEIGIHIDRATHCMTLDCVRGL